MALYVIVILLVTAINAVNELYCFRKKNQKLTFILMGLSIFILCFLAGARDITVGTDVRGYVSRLIQVANSNGNIIQYLRSSNSDLLFAVLVYVSHLFGDIHVTLFAIQLAIVVPIYVLAYKENNEVPFTATILVFLLTMYCISFNLIRQSIAMSFGILSYYYFDKIEYKKTVILFACAILFHQTAIVLIAMYIVNYVIKNTKATNRIFVIITLLVSICLLTALSGRLIALTQYASYLDNENYMKEFSLMSILKKIFILILWCMSFWGIGKKDKDKFETALIFSIISVVTTVMSFYIPGTGRLGYYFNNLVCLLIIKYVPNSFKQKGLVRVALICIFFALWWNMTAVENDISNVYPYTSEILNIL